MIRLSINHIYENFDQPDKKQLANYNEIATTIPFQISLI